MKPKKINGRETTLDRIDTAVEKASKLANPVDNTYMQLGFRKKMVKQFNNKTINEII